jgi:hypothetical protein
VSETPISILQRAADLGIKLAFKLPGTLTIETSKAWPKEFAELLRDCKPRLIALLELPFVMVYSKTLEETVFFCEDEATKAALIEAGASEWSIYTRAELRILCEANRVAPLSSTELKQLHQIKRTFNARYSP